ncbi:laminin subunit alpha [Amyelois transitella]|uniref:laminin subunit alpha n=1 Tax=Amyelois transitella TaxID=680683 RepID=UPI00298FAC20|nr:laminin subunit alpha [Amyelois transitella]
MEVRGRERQCVPCNCSPTGSTSTSCSADGKCNCLVSFGGKQCAQCSPGYYKYPECLPCNCDVSGSLGSTCDDSGLCHCKPNFDGTKCDKCKPQFYNYPACEECNCDPRGVIPQFAGCGSVPEGELCLCKEYAHGRICNDCKPLFWNLQEYNPLGCEKCNCNVSGTLGGLGACDTRSGQCICKMNVGERQCDQCRDGFYQLESNNVFGCTECDCDPGGSIDNNCDKLTGQCRCHSRVEGRRCDRPIRAHYFPTLHQFQYEVEEGLTQSGPVRYRNNEAVFPGYSWKGYVVFSILQNEVINVVHILSKSSLYRMVIKYANTLKDPVVATVIITPENVNDIQQKFSVLLKPTTQPQLVTVAGEKGLAPSPFVMNPGNWTVTIKTTKEVMIDFFVLVPETYYEATMLTKLVDKPCVVNDNNLCRHYVYPSVQGRPRADVTSLSSSATIFIDGEQQLKELDAEPNTIPLLSNDQNSLEYSMTIEPPGRYVLVVEYVTPVGNDMTASNESYAFSARNTLTVRFQSGSDPETYAIVKLNECPYTSPCRQVVVNDLTMIHVVEVTSKENTVHLDGERDTLAGIKSIIAIPEADWHLDYMTPRPYCLRRNGKCEPAVFSAAVDSKKVEIETGSGGDTVTRPPILDNSTTVVYLAPSTEPVKIETKVPSPGDYIFVVHYYQPDHPKSNVDAVIMIDGTLYQTQMPVEHCPSNSGCRSLLQTVDGRRQFPVTENITITFSGEGSKGVWLDYLLVVGAPDFTEAALKEANMVDYTRQFIETCAANHYQISRNSSDFCRESMFSITSEYNSGALACLCDFMGSTELECDTFGGQCPCKPNVIGRSCRACRTGYYGFPNCKPCHCPSTAICDDNGMCICPKNVEGEDCNRCKKYTFNFDVQRGCDDCNCNPLGVVNNNLQCEADSGNCDCKENVIGRVCDHCVPGHYAFPDCVPCTCDRDGTTDDVCDQNTAQCYCKKHVRGQACNTCKEDYFNLQGDNPDGCTKCYCFGKTTRCASSYLAWGEINGMSDWYLANIEVNRTLNIFPHPDLPIMQNDSTIEVDFQSLTSEPKVLYFGAPQYYLGKRLTSYGGYLTYAIYYTAQDKGRPSAEPDLIVGGSNSYIVHNSIEQPPSETAWTHSVRITENQFTNLDGTAVTRDQFMNILVNVTSIYVRATYWDEGIITQLMSVLLDVAVPVEYDEYDQSKQATSVEQCQCPPAYRGMSCEQCAAGYYRLSSGPHAGRCVPCQCNGHSRECDVNTGICLACTDNTMGDHCEQCIIGYHGNATVGTPRDCLICACPLPYASNNFAIGCELSQNGSLISCDCQPGYGGARCEYCAAGYFGQPELPGDYCKPCNCSGNINPNDPGSCDSITGDCLKCVNNTAGAACNLCAPGFFGDAIFSKNCTACICDELGMDYCDPSTGTCVCQPGVIGEKCDRCEEDHWGLNSGRGCTPCDCALASNSTQCDDNNGQCSCAKGVTGRHCEHCAAGYWNYSKDGCDHCNCNTGYSVGFMCNATGQCECLPGVVGEKCDRCPERWVLIPNQGCQECDSCTDALIFTVQDLRDLLLNETQEFKDKADSFFTTQRLNYISNQTEALRPRVSELQNVDLADVTTAFKTLESAAKNLLRSAEFAATDSDKQIVRAADLAVDANKILRMVRSSADEAAAVIAHVADLATGLELSQQPKVDSALTEAKQIRDDLADKDLKPKELIAFVALDNATTQIERMNIFVQPVNEQAMRFDSLVNNTRDLKKKLDEMLEHTDLAQHTAEMAKRLNFKNKQSKSNSKVGSVTDLSSAAMLDLIEAAHDTTNATQYTNIATDAVADAVKALEEIRQQNINMDDRLIELDKKMADLNNYTNVAHQHAMSLGNRADNLRDLAKRENNNTRTQDAYAAASAYSSIVQEIADAKMAADQADEADKNATSIENDLKQRVGPAREKSQKLLQEALQALDTVDKTLGPNLTLAMSSLTNASETLGRAGDDTNAIELAMPSKSTFALQEEAAKADRVNAVVRETLDTMSELGKHLASSKQWAQTLPKQADEAQKMAANVESLLKQTDKSDALDMKYRAVKMMQEDLENRRAEANAKLLRLKEQIEQARTVANRIEFGVSFDRLSTLQPRLPDNIDEMSTSTQVSAYFRTKEKDGFLLYLGNPKDTNLRRSKSDDFMVLSIQNGYPRLEMDIGDSHDSGRDPAKFISDKYVADDQWYQVIVNRVGRSVKLSIREALANGSEYVHSKEGMLPGTHTIFNLDKQKSKLYVGGVPSDAKLQKISFPAFEGQIEELMIGDTPVGLWNFVNATNLKGSRKRNILIPPPVSQNEYRFNGRSHVTMSGAKHLVPEKNHIQLFFRTYAPNGLIYLVGENNHFFSVQMQDGAVYMQIAFGPKEEDLIILGTSKTYNDGHWHKLDATRYLSDCSLKVDGEILRCVPSAVTSTVKEIPAIGTMNFGGGNKGISRVTSQGFDGCIRQINIDRINVELGDSVESIGMVYGCQIASLVSLSGQDSYLRFTDVTLENPQITLKFKTSSPDGLLFVYSSRTHTTSSQDLISLSLIKGQLVLTSQREKLDTGLNTYNDSQWHVVTVTHGTKALKMVIDDYDYFSTDTAPDPLHILNGVLFIGGIQPNYVIAGIIGSRVPFQGCIADTTLNGRVLNLLEPYSNSSVTFGRCGTVTTTGGVLPGGDYPTLPPPTVLPTPPPTPHTEAPVVSQTPVTSKARASDIQATPRSTTVKKVSTTPRPKLQPETGCALAYDSYYTVGDPEEGYRFGSRRDSRIEYGKLPGRQLELYDLTIGFRTFDKHGGLMFYAEADSAPEQFLAVFMKDGLLHVSFNCGERTGRVTSSQTFNDTEWHSLTLVRNGGHSKVTVDNKEVGETSVSCVNPKALAPPYFYGGIRKVTTQYNESVAFYQPFKGCMKGLLMNGQPVRDEMQRTNALRCVDNVEDGIYFEPSSGEFSSYLKLVNHFRVGNEVGIAMEVKPRNSTGLLLSVYGKKDYLVIELLENSVVARVENGMGPFQASFNFGENFSLCDGKWHTIHALKSHHVVTIGVDGHFSDAVLGRSGSTDTRFGLFIGGHDRDIKSLPGTQSKQGFVGCVRNIRIKEKPVAVPSTAISRGAHIGVCPLD